MCDFVCNGVDAIGSTTDPPSSVIPAQRLEQMSGCTAADMATGSLMIRTYITCAS